MKNDDFKELEYRDYAKDLPSGQEQIPTLKIPVSTRPPSSKSEPAKPKISLISRLLRAKWKILGGVFAALCFLIIFLPKLIPTGWLADALEKELGKSLQCPVKIHAVSLGWFESNIKQVDIYDSVSGSNPLLSFDVKIKTWLPGLVSGNPQIKGINFKLANWPDKTPTTSGQVEITGDIVRFLDKDLTAFKPPAEIKIVLKNVSLPFEQIFPAKWPVGLQVSVINGILNLTAPDRENISVTGEFKIARLVYEDMVFENIVSPLKISDGQLEVNELRGILNDGSLILTGAVDFREKLPVLLNIKMEKVKISYFFYAKVVKFFQPWFPQAKEIELARVKTLLSGNCNLTVTGKNQQSDLSGDGNIVMEHGLIEGSTVLKEVFDLLKKPEWARFEFDRMEQSFKIRGNRIYNQGSRLTGSKLTLELNGWTAFSGEIEQHLIIRPSKECEEIIIETCNIINESGGIPISGTISRPKINTKEIKKKIAERLRKYIK